MVKKLNVLGIDDHAVVLEGYFSIFRSLDVFEELIFTKASDCRSGYEVIVQNKDFPFDIAVLDYSMPAYPDKELYSGEDLAVLLRNVMPTCSIILMTMHKHPEVVASILERVKPEGFINKSDCNTTELTAAFREVIGGNSYYSKTVSDFIDRQNSTVLLEDTDIKILLLLANGIEPKNLNKHIPLSQNSIEERRERICSLLGVEAGNDSELVSRAKTLGYI